MVLGPQRSTDLGFQRKEMPKFESAEISGLLPCNWKRKSHILKAKHCPKLWLQTLSVERKPWSGTVPGKGGQGRLSSRRNEPTPKAEWKCSLPRAYILESEDALRRIQFKIVTQKTPTVIDPLSENRTPDLHRLSQCTQMTLSAPTLSVDAKLHPTSASRPKGTSYNHRKPSPSHHPTPSHVHPQFSRGL